MRKRLLLICALLCTNVLLAQTTFTIGDLTYQITGSNTAKVADCSTSTTSVVIPSTVTYQGTTYSVTSIGYEAFYNCRGLTSVTIPNSVTSIGNYAFSGCSGLTSVTIPNSVTSIGECAFEGCSGLTSVTIPNSVTSIGSFAFGGCSGLTSVIIPNSVTSIGWYAFYLVKHIIYNGTATGSPWGALSVNGFVENGFVYADSTKTSLLAYIGTSTSVTIPNSVTSIGSSAFSGCSGLTSVTIGNSVTSIGSNAFYGCSGLTSVTIGNSVTSIGSSAFYECSGLTSVTIPNSVTSIGYEAFYLVKNIIYNGTATGSPWGALSVNGYIEGDFVYANNTKTSLLAYIGTSTSVTIPNSVT
ncbi:MAG: leucine-rich repeat domain-containing protein, partial [Bacteroidales bacterium]|nr:leucine-rich repeat domain-containing protein [Bacteroidales bacterium]